MRRANGIRRERAGAECGARVVQRGVTARLALRGSPHKGWGVVATAPIAKGAFVCEYAGELLTNQQVWCMPLPPCTTQG
jgi:SET domain-containing protein